MAAEVEALPQALRTPRIAAVAGILFALLFGAVIVLIRTVVPASPDQAGAWLTNSTLRSLARLALYLIPFAGILFLWTIGVMRDQIGAREDKFFATIYLGSGILFVGMLFLLGAISGGLLTLTDNGASPPTEVWQYGRSVAYDLLVVYAMKMAGIFAITGSVVAWRLRLFPTWLALAGFLVGLLCMFATGAVPWIELAFPIWILAVNIDGLVRSFHRHHHPA